MSLKMPAVSGGGSFEVAPEGNHLAVCYATIDFGTQPSTFNGETNYKRIIYIAWELSDETMSDGRPYIIGKQYTYSSHSNATLRKDLEAWRGKKFSDEEIVDFDIAKLLGTGCMLLVQHTERQRGQYLNTYANIGAIAKLPRGVKTPELHNEPIEFSLDDPDWDVFEGLRDWMKDKIRAAPEYRAAAGFPNEDAVSTAPPPVTKLDDLNDEVPF